MQCYSHAFTFNYSLLCGSVDWAGESLDEPDFPYGDSKQLDDDMDSDSYLLAQSLPPPQRGA